MCLHFTFWAFFFASWGLVLGTRAGPGRPGDNGAILPPPPVKLLPAPPGGHPAEVAPPPSLPTFNDGGSGRHLRNVLLVSIGSAAVLVGAWGFLCARDRAARRAAASATNAANAAVDGVAVLPPSIKREDAMLSFHVATEAGVKAAERLSASEEEGADVCAICIASLHELPGDSSCNSTCTNTPGGSPRASLGHEQPSFSHPLRRLATAAAAAVSAVRRSRDSAVAPSLVGPARPAVVALACGHAYHTRCLNRWLKTGNTCPTCRSEIAEPLLSALRVYGGPRLRREPPTQPERPLGPMPRAGRRSRLSQGSALPADLAAVAAVPPIELIELASHSGAPHLARPSPRLPPVRARGSPLQGLHAAPSESVLLEEVRVVSSATELNINTSPPEMPRAVPGPALPS